MKKSEELNALLLSLKKYYIYLHDCDKVWVQMSVQAREKEKDLLMLSDQLSCLSRPNKTKLSSLELQKTYYQITLLIEEKFSSLSAAIRNAINTQDELTSLRQVAEAHYFPVEDNIVHRLIKNVHVSWLFLQMRSSRVSVALKKINYRSPETVKVLLQSISGSDEYRSELQETLEIAENLMRHLEITCNS